MLDDVIVGVVEPATGRQRWVAGGHVVARDQRVLRASSKILGPDAGPVRILLPRFGAGVVVVVGAEGDDRVQPTRAGLVDPLVPVGQSSRLARPARVGDTHAHHLGRAGKDPAEGQPLAIRREASLEV